MHSLSVYLLLIGLALAAGAGGAGAAQPPGQGQPPPAAQQQKLIQPNATLVERLRRLLNLTPPLAVGGSRSGAGAQVCLVSPWLQTQPQRAEDPNRQQPKAVVPTATPTLLSAGPLNEVQLLRNNRIVWQQRASSTEAISGPIPWPIEPLRPGEQAVLRLRPRGASGGDFAAITLQAADAATLQRLQSLVAALQARPEGWQSAIEREAGANPAVAVALASAPTAPLAIQQALVAAGGCANTGSNP
ncbi:MAG: hypothetical protein KFB97_03395 [Cyanobium sp. M30B3]|nr:MAG: hypothetical protein KFB97_03395 [Cyanobium sp. M30B3]